MKRQLLIGGMVASVLAMGTVSLEAALQVGDRIRFGNGVGSPGGIFIADVVSNTSEPDFRTFCVEITEFINFSTTYAVEKIGLVTDKGGRNLGAQTAWLYTRFLDGQLVNFDAGNASDVNALQLGIWLGMSYTPLEIQNHIGNGWYSTYSPILNAKPWLPTFNAELLSGVWQGTGDINVISLRTFNGQGVFTGYAQDQLIRVPSPMPEPASVAVWLALAGVALGASKWRRRQRGRLA